MAYSRGPGRRPRRPPARPHRLRRFLRRPRYCPAVPDRSGGRARRRRRGPSARQSVVDGRGDDVRAVRHHAGRTPGPDRRGRDVGEGWSAGRGISPANDHVRITLTIHPDLVGSDIERLLRHRARRGPSHTRPPPRARSVPVARRMKPSSPGTTAAQQMAAWNDRLRTTGGGTSPAAVHSGRSGQRPNRPESACTDDVRRPHHAVVG